MIFLIKKADLSDYTRVSVNVSDLLIGPAIRDAHTFDVLPLLSTQDVQQLAAYLVDAGRKDFAASYATSELAGFPEVELVLLQASPLYGLHVLYTTAVRPLLCYETYRRFLLDHGAHVTENGVETFSTGNNQPISQAQRAEMRADAAAKCTYYRAILPGALHTYRGANAPITTCGTNRPSRPSSGGLRSVAL
jgi:hypothetical protein